VTTAIALLDALRRRHVAVSAEGGELCLRAPRGAITPELVAEVKKRKAEVLAALRATSGVDAYRRRIAEARDSLDLYAVVSDAEVAYSAGTVTGDEVERLAALCNVAAQQLPLRADPCPTCEGRDWWMSGRDGGIRCHTCSTPGDGDQVWPPPSTEVAS
jgi:hypothetical protein